MGEVEREVCRFGAVLAGPACSLGRVEVISQDRLGLLDDKVSKDAAYSGSKRKSTGGEKVVVRLFAAYLYDFVGAERAVQEVVGHAGALLYRQAAKAIVVEVDGTWAETSVQT